MSTAQQDKSFFERALNPIIQALITFGCVLLVIGAAQLVRLSGAMEVPRRFPWMTAAAFMLCYAMFNSVFALSAKSIPKYWGRSIYSFIGLAAASGGFAYLVSQVPIGDAGSYRWIYVVVTIGYFVFLSMMTFLRGIVTFAQREEWNQPKISQDNKKKDDRDRHIK